VRVPAPGEQSRGEYRRTLAVPQLDLWSEDIGSTHLWYLMDDLAQLYRLIDRHHVTVWGQVRQYEVGAAAPAIELNQATFARLSACADALNQLCTLMRTGRGKPVTDAELDASGGLTPKFERACRDLLKLVNGDGKRFVELLEQKKISGMNSGKIRNFRDFFEEHGHIVADEPLTTDIIRGRLAKHCAPSMDRGEIDLATIDRLLDEAFPAGDSIVDLAHTVGVQASLLPSGE
jgi:hypothetical protein